MRVTIWRWVRDVERRSTAGHHLVHGQHAVGEGNSDALVEPGTKQRALIEVGALHEQDPVFELVDRDRGYEHLR